MRAWNRRDKKNRRFQVAGTGGLGLDREFFSKRGRLDLRGKRGFEGDSAGRPLQKGIRRGAKRAFFSRPGTAARQISRAAAECAGEGPVP